MSAGIPPWINVSDDDFGWQTGLAALSDFRVFADRQIKYSKKNQPDAHQQPWTENFDQAAFSRQHSHMTFNECFVARTQAAHAKEAADPFQDPAGEPPRHARQ